LASYIEGRAVWAESAGPSPGCCCSHVDALAPVRNLPICYLGRPAGREHDLHVVIPAGDDIATIQPTLQIDVSAAFGVHGFDPDEIGSRFADIFRNNSANNGLLLAQVDPKVVGELWDFAEQHPGEQLTLSLENRTINLPGRTTYPFHIDDVTRQRLLAGLDAVGETLEHADDIAAYEAHRPSFMPTTS